MARIKNQYKRSGANLPHHPYEPSPNFVLKYPIVPYKSAGNGKKNYVSPSVSVRYGGAGTITEKSSRKSKQLLSADLYRNTSFNEYVTIMWIVLVLAFFSAVLNNGSNPIDMIFGDGAGNGGILNIFSDVGTNIIAGITKTRELVNNLGLGDYTALEGVSGLSAIWATIKGWVGSVMTISSVLINLMVQLIIFLFRIIFYIISGGQLG